MAVELAIAERILHAACDQFAEKGFEATSTREICEAAGVTKPMLYYYFEHKDGLRRGVLRHFMGLLVVRIAAADAAAPPTSPVRLTELAWAIFEFCREHESFIRWFLALVYGPAQLAAVPEWQDDIDRLDAIIVGAITTLIDAGVVRRGSEETLLLAFHAVINISITRVLKIGKGAALSRALAEQLVHDLLRGFGTEGHPC